MKEHCHRVTWVVTKDDDTIKMSELLYGKDNSDAAIAEVKARYTQGETIKIVGVTQLR